MAQSDTDDGYPTRISHGSDRMRRFFAFFGIRSAADDHRDTDDE